MRFARILLTVIATSVCCAANALAAPFTITPTTNTTTLINQLLGTTTGLSGISVSLSGDPTAFGTYASDPFGLADGIVLSSGRVADIVGVNTRYTGGLDLSTDFGGDNAPDVTQMDISFVADGTSSLFFNYVFGSEEFPEFIGIFNDSFSLILDGTNVAFLHCGPTVAVNNFTGSCFSELTLNPAGPSTVTKLDAWTDVLTARLGLTPGAHTLRLDVRDAGNGNADSAVFIQGGTAAPVPEPATMMLLGTGLAGLAARRRLKTRA